MSHILDARGVKHSISDVHAVYRIFQLKEKSGSNPWPVIKRIIEVWSSKQPKKWQSYLTYLKETKETRKVTTVGTRGWRGVSRTDRKNDGIIVYAIDMPEPVMMMIRAVYSTEELPMNKEFFREFGRQFPQFKIIEKR